MIELEFLRFCLGNSDTFPFIKENEWEGVFCFCLQQSIIGIGFAGVHRIMELRNYGTTESGGHGVLELRSDKKAEIKVPKDLALKWFALAEQIKQRNQLMNQRCVELVEELRQDGFLCCILKGQGNALLYDVRSKKEEVRSLALLRQPGDIDVWVRKKFRDDSLVFRVDIKEIIRYVKKINPNGKALYHHVDYGDYLGVEVEVHYRPSFMFTPKYNHRLQKWFCKMADGGCMMAELPGVGAIPVPDWEFNVIFQLSHIYNHVLHEGIGLRQIVDYYFLLKSENNNQLKIENGKLRITLRYLGLEKIAGAVMWVLHEVLGLKKEYLIVPEDEKRGRVLLQEILRGGNFGQYDEDGRRKKEEGRMMKNVLRMKRDIRLLKYFPSECLWEPVFRTYHFFWRLNYN